MGSSYWERPLIFLVGVAVTLYLVALLLRFLLQALAANPRNPLAQMVVRVTDPVLAPMRRVLPSSRRVDTASLVAMLVLQLVHFQLIHLIARQSLWLELGLLPAAVAELAVLVLNVYTFTILIEVVLSWINPGTYNPAIAVLYQLNAPVLSRARDVIPPLGGIDLSPLVVLILIQVIKMLIAPLGVGI